MHRTGRVGGGTELHAFRASLSPNLHVFISPEAAQTLFGVFMEDLSHKHNLLNHWLLVIASTGSPSHFPRHGGGGEGPDIPTLYGVSSTGKHPPALERGHVGHLGKQTPPGTSPPVHTHAGLRCQQEEQAGPRAAKNAPGH